MIKGGGEGCSAGDFEIVRSLPHGHVAAAMAVLKRLGLHQIIASRGSVRRNLIVALIAAGIMEPQSKLATARGFDVETLICTLPRECSLLFDDRDLAEISCPDYPGERLIVCRNPILAERRRRKRLELLDATEKLLAPVVKATKRKSPTLRGKDEIGLRVGKDINKYKVGKHFKLTITDTSFEYSRKESQIQTEAALDGFYVVRTSIAPETIAGPDVVSTYKRLASVERAFRSMKTVDLKVRPVYHRLENRVRSHIFLCMLAYYVEWEMRRLLGPVLFDDEDKPQAQQKRKSVVAPTQKSDNAKAKASSKRSEDDLPIHSFRTLLKDLATITRNEIQPNLPNCPTFSKTTQPTQLQQKALDLLGVKL